MSAAYFGARVQRSEDEAPIRSVSLSPFLIGKYEVTQAQWEAVMHRNPSHFAGHDLPVENVSFNDIGDFCEATGLQRPTEAQWEYACRAGTRGPYSPPFRDPDPLAWHEGNSESRTHAVGLKKPNAWGLHDMHGNVWETCEDVWDPEFYQKLEYGAKNPKSEAGPNPRAHSVRGGAWLHDVSHCRSGNRDYSTIPGDYIGFRPAYQLP